MITEAQLLTLPPDIVERAQRLAPAQREIVLLTLVGFSRAEIARLRGTKEPTVFVGLRWAAKKIGRIPYTPPPQVGTSGSEEERYRREAGQERRRRRERLLKQMAREAARAAKGAAARARKLELAEDDRRMDEHARATMRPLEAPSAVDYLQSGASNLGAAVSNGGGIGATRGRPRQDVRRAA